mmetsp:Transcript_38678/g.125504  ORF Transcript_38678/g.125504 Transcript_38678/m.125504 type:complete len:227 (+) Transcript_38678:766-1446(+)
MKVASHFLWHCAPSDSASRQKAHLSGWSGVSSSPPAKTRCTLSSTPFLCASSARSALSSPPLLQSRCTLRSTRSTSIRVGSGIANLPLALPLPLLLPLLLLLALLLPPPPPPPPSASQAAALESCTRGGMCACWLSESKARKAGTCSTCGRDTLSHTSSRSSTTRYAALNSSSSAGSASAGWRWERLLLKLSGWLSSRQRTRPRISRTSGSIALRTLRVYDLAAIV